jgi:Tfp pilus assembly protein PilX
MMTKFCAMESRLSFVVVLALMLALGGCGVAYQASTEMRAARMQRDLKVGQSAVDVHQQWGEPDLRQDADQDTEIWSYAKRSNTNDIAATLLYTNTKEGDQGQFVDLTFVDGKLVSWKQTARTMPPKKGGPGLSFGVRGPGSTTGNARHY